ncbi:ORF58 [Ranid herpesvirus 2]|uniref:ORF58 n=1 Tax=Ranid herpesvirus 2 TaxID=389214 RepID=Q14W48_9VIRU|nr:ORF58 [Ranid herpesvirus 2]ABG25641.1 ORF58 [Ranid herpesvirus 2]
MSNPALPEWFPGLCEADCRKLQLVERHEYIYRLMVDKVNNHHLNSARTRFYQLGLQEIYDKHVRKSAKQRFMYIYSQVRDCNASCKLLIFNAYFVHDTKLFQSLLGEMVALQPPNLYEIYCTMLTFLPGEVPHWGRITNPLKEKVYTLKENGRWHPNPCLALLYIEIALGRINVAKWKEYKETRKCRAPLDCIERDFWMYAVYNYDIDDMKEMGGIMHYHLKPAYEYLCRCGFTLRRASYAINRLRSGRKLLTNDDDSQPLPELHNSIMKEIDKWYPNYRAAEKHFPF